MNETKRTTLSVGRERAVLVGVITPGRAVDPFNPLGELSALADAAGADVVDGVIQRRANLCSKTCIGKGKLAELRDKCDAREASVVIFDNDLTPAQIRVIEERTDRKIIDRSELILDIFARRARTHESRLQVELAQLQYTAPRLRGMWTHLERIAGAGGGGAAGAVGGIGTRGPGERQIEIDRRIVSDRISYLKREISGIDQRKIRQTQARHNEFTVSLVGYTNSGKSTLMNTCTGAERVAEDALFVTLDTKTVRWPLGEGQFALLSDTVGFVRDLPHRLVASFRATLEEAIHADLLLHVVDASSQSAISQVEAVQAVLAELGCADRPTIMVLNKIDVADDLSIAQILENRHGITVRISAKTGAGIDKLVESVLAQINKGTVRTTLRLPVGDGKVIAALSEAGRVLDRRYAEQHVEIDVEISRARLEQLRGRYHQLIACADNSVDAVV